MRSHVRVVAEREYLARVRTRAFWLSTLVFPVLALGVLLLPALLLNNSVGTLQLVVVDETGRVAEALVAHLAREHAGEEASAAFEVRVEPPAPDRDVQRRALARGVLDQEFDAWLWIDAAGLAENRVEYHGTNVSNVITQGHLSRELSHVVRSLRLDDAGYDEEVLSELSAGIELSRIRVAEGGSRAESGRTRIALAYALCFLLYTILAIYGAQVMNGVLEEKSTRVVELVLSTVRPFELMMGKLLGIGAVGLTQLSVWVGTLALVTAPVAAPFLEPRLGAMPSYDLVFGLHFLAHFLVGYFVYASIYAAVGAAFNTVQEAQQFIFVAVMVLLSALMLFLPVSNNPDASLSVAVSLVPLYMPLIMLLRIAVSAPPLWQIATAYALAGVFAFFMVWLCGRIYRVGILLHGSKPSLREVVRWVRQG